MKICATLTRDPEAADGTQMVVDLTVTVHTSIVEINTSTASGAGRAWLGVAYLGGWQRSVATPPALPSAAPAADQTATAVGTVQTASLEVVPLKRR